MLLVEQTRQTGSLLPASVTVMVTRLRAFVYALRSMLAVFACAVAATRRYLSLFVSFVRDSMRALFDAFSLCLFTAAQLRPALVFTLRACACLQRTVTRSGTTTVVPARTRGNAPFHARNLYWVTRASISPGCCRLAAAAIHCLYLLERFATHWRWRFRACMERNAAGIQTRVRVVSALAVAGYPHVSWATA